MLANPLYEHLAMLAGAWIDLAANSSKNKTVRYFMEEMQQQLDRVYGVYRDFSADDYPYTGNVVGILRPLSQHCQHRVESTQDHGHNSSSRSLLSS